MDQVQNGVFEENIGEVFKKDPENKCKALKRGSLFDGGIISLAIFVLFFSSHIMLGSAATIENPHHPDPLSSIFFLEPIDACLVGYNDQTLEDLTLEECKKKCSEATSFPCKSLDYKTSDMGKEVRVCHLSKETKKSQPDSFKEPCFVPDHLYIERVGIE